MPTKRPRGCVSSVGYPQNTPAPLPSDLPPEPFLQDQFTTEEAIALDFPTHVQSHSTFLASGFHFSLSHPVQHQVGSELVTLSNPSPSFEHPTNAHCDEDSPPLMNMLDGPPDSQSPLSAFPTLRVNPASVPIIPTLHSHSASSHQRHNSYLMEAIDCASPTPPSAHEQLLTESNLTQLQADQSSSLETSPHPAPFDTIVRHHIPSLARQEDAPDRGSTTTSDMTTASKAERLLWAYRLNIDTKIAFAPSIQTLVNDIKRPRLEDISPNSKKIAASNFKTMKMDEADTVHELVDKLLYRCALYDGDEGESLVARTFDCQWPDQVPKPVGGANEAELQDAMESLGCPPRPKPDVTYGYADETLDGDQLKLLCGWYRSVLAIERAPWFLYLVGEWKGKGRTMAEARLQARRDCASASNCLYNFCKAGGIEEPTANMTCVFSLCVDSTQAEYRLHWRHVDSDGRISYEAERVSGALLYDEESVFRLRGCILKTLDWVRGDRLTTVRNTLKLIKKPAPPPKAPVLPQEASTQEGKSSTQSSTLQEPSSGANGSPKKRKKGSKA
ncbi:MAG: hypothetical protein Q9170_008367 [Blastenia crenularia]